MDKAEARTKKAADLRVEQITEVESVEIVEQVVGSGNIYAAWDFTFELDGRRYNVEVAASSLSEDELTEHCSWRASEPF